MTNPNKEESKETSIFLAVNSNLVIYYLLFSNSSSTRQVQRRFYNHHFLRRHVVPSDESDGLDIRRKMPFRVRDHTLYNSPSFLFSRVFPLVYRLVDRAIFSVKVCLFETLYAHESVAGILDLDL